MKEASNLNGKTIFKASKVEAAVRRDIEMGILVDRIPTDLSLAKRFGVNVKTVTMAMGRLSFEGLVSRRRKAGSFVVPRKKRVGLRSTVVLLIRTKGHLFESLSSALVKNLQASGNCPVILDAETSLAIGNGTMIDQIASLNPKAVVIHEASEWVREELVEKLSGAAMLIELFGGVNPPVTKGAFRVTPDFFAGGYESTRHLLRQGRRRPLLMDALFELPPHQYPGSAHYQYNMGYRRALEEAGLAGSERFFFNSHDEANDAQRLRTMLTEKDHPDGILALGDFRAVNAIKTIAALGLKIPQDLAVIGFYDTPWCKMTAPPLASVSIRPAAFVAEISRIISNPQGVPSVTKVPIQLMVRSSADRQGAGAFDHVAHFCSSSIP